MKCPACGAKITSPAESCGSCSYEFSVELSKELKGYFQLTDEAAFLTSLASEINERRKTVTARLKDAEQRLTALISSLAKMAKSPAKEKKAPEPIVEKESAPAAAAPAAKEAPPQAAVVTDKVKVRENRFTEEKLGQRWLLVTGIIVLLFGVGYFLKYSFEQGWIGPAARIIMAYLFGIGLLAGGNRFRVRSYEAFGLSLMGGGLAVFYFSTFAAFQLYGLFGQGLSFFFMILVTLLASTLALVYDEKWLAVLALVGGFLTPVFLSTGENNQVALMTYMVLLNGGILAIAFFRRWAILNILGLVFTWGLYSAWHGVHYDSPAFWVTLFFITIFFLFYSLVPFAYYFGGTKTDEELKGFYLVIPGSFIAFAYSYAIISDRFSSEAVSAVAVFYAFIFLLMAAWLYREGRSHIQAFVVLLAKSAFFLAIAIPLLFEGPWITLFWTGLALLLLWLGVNLERKSLSAQAYLLLLVGLIKYLFYDFDKVFGLTDDVYFAEGYSHALFTRYVLEIFVLGTIFFFRRLVKNDDIRLIHSSGDRRIFSVILGVFIFITLQFEIFGFFYDYLPEGRYAAASIYWALFSIAVMALGFRYNNSTVRRTAMALFGITVLKVFLFDMASFSTPYRILSFILVGFVLVGASYLYYRFRDTIIEAVADREEDQ